MTISSYSCKHNSSSCNSGAVPGTMLAVPMHTDICRSSISQQNAGQQVKQLDSAKVDSVDRRQAQCLNHVGNTIRDGMLMNQLQSEPKPLSIHASRAYQATWGSHQVQAVLLPPC